MVDGVEGRWHGPGSGRWDAPGWWYRCRAYTVYHLCMLVRLHRYFTASWPGPLFPGPCACEPVPAHRSESRRQDVPRTWGRTWAGHGQDGVSRGNSKVGIRVLRCRRPLALRDRHGHANLSASMPSIPPPSLLHAQSVLVVPVKQNIVSHSDPSAGL